MDYGPGIAEPAPETLDAPGAPARAASGAAPEIAVFGEWNTGNLGDRAIHAAVRRFFEECGWRPRSFHLGSLSPAAGADEPSVAAGDSRGDVTSALGHLRPPVKRAVRGVLQRVRMLRLLPRLDGVQAISVGGGALLSDDNLHFPQSLVELARYARALDKPLLCLGCSAEGPWSARGWRMIREFLEACSVLAVRDGETAARLAATLGTAPPILGDFCLAGAFPAGADAGSAGRHQLAINACQLAGPWAAEQGRFEDALVTVAEGAAAHMGARGIGICIFTTGLAEDARVAQRVHARLEAAGARLYLPANLGQLTVLLRTAAVVVAARLHGAILPLASGVPVVGFGVSPKLRSFFSTVNIGRYCHGIESGAQLVHWLAFVDLEVVAADQRRALSHSRIWSTRSQVQARVASLAAARGAG